MVDNTEYIKKIKDRFSLEAIKQYLDSFEDKKVLVIGDTIIDEYCFVEPKGRTMKDPILSVDYIKEEVYAGGILAIANHVSNFVKNVSLLTLISEHNSKKDFIIENLQKNISPYFFIKKNSPTIVKKRYINRLRNEKLFKIEYINDSLINKDLEDEIVKFLEQNLMNYDLVIVDTAGRDALSDNLIKELNDLNTTVQADQRLLVIAADIGQAAEKQAQAFHDSCRVSGVIITKLEGTAKGGGALSACSVTNSPITFIGVGEKIEDLEIFHPQRFVGKLIGMGDIESLLEKAKEVISEEESKDLGERMLKGDFNLIDLYQQMKSLKKMGSFSKLIDMIPGMGSVKLPKEMLDVQEGKLEKWRFAMDSMTKQELENPNLISAERIDRISAGSGLKIAEVRELLKQYRQSKKMIKMFKSEQDISKMMKKMGGQIPGMGM